MTVMCLIRCTCRYQISLVGTGVSSKPLMACSMPQEMRCRFRWYGSTHLLSADCYSTRLAYRAGVTTGITAPSSSGFLAGLSTVFSTGAAHKLSKGAVAQSVAALHIAVGFSSPSTSTQIAVLRRLLLGGGKGDLGARFKDIVRVSGVFE